MEDPKQSKSILGFAIALMLFLVGLDYLGVVAPQILPDNVVMDFFVPLAFEFNLPIRVGLLICVIVYATITEGSSQKGDEFATSKERKTIMGSLFIISAVIFSSIHLMPLFLFKVGLPIFLVTMIYSSFIVVSFFKKKKKEEDDDFGFKTPDFPIHTDQSFVWEDKVNGIYLNIENPFRGISIIGSAGAGKSYTMIEPIIQMAVRKMFTGLVYDFKYPVLAKVVADEFDKLGSTYYDGPDKALAHPTLERDTRNLWFISFKDPRYSHRVNPISPKYLKSQSYAAEYAKTLLFNIIYEQMKKADFFANSAESTLKGIFWWLYKKRPEYCNIPMAVSIMMQEYKKVLAMMTTDDEASEMIASIIVAMKENAGGQLAGVISTLQTALDKINSPEACYVLSPPDEEAVPLDFNNPANPGIVVLGNDPELHKTISPLCALIAHVTTNVINAPNRIKSIFMLDEAPTLRIVGLEQLPATGRSNKIATILAAQDESQYRLLLGEKESEALLANLGNVLIGNVNDLKTAEKYSKFVGERKKIERSWNSSKSYAENTSSSAGDSWQVKMEPLIKPYEIVSLPVGTFFGKVATAEKKEYDLFFKIRPTIKQQVRTETWNPIVDTDLPLDDIEMLEICKRQSAEIKSKAWELVDEGAREACRKGTVDERVIFPNHFFDGKRLVTTNGEVLYAGIEYDRKTSTIRGTPDFNKPINHNPTV